MKGVWHMMKWVITEHYKNQFPFYWTHQGNTNWQCFRNLIVVWKPSKEDKDLEIYKAWQEAEAYFCHTNLPNLFTCFNEKRLKMCMVTHFKQLFLFLENWLPESPRGDFITNWNEGVIVKLHDISILRLYHRL